MTSSQTSFTPNEAAAVAGEKGAVIAVRLKEEDKQRMGTNRDYVGMTVLAHGGIDKAGCACFYEFLRYENALGLVKMGHRTQLVPYTKDLRVDVVKLRNNDLLYFDRKNIRRIFSNYYHLYIYDYEVDGWVYYTTPFSRFVLNKLMVDSAGDFLSDEDFVDLDIITTERDAANTLLKKLIRKKGIK